MYIAIVKPVIDNYERYKQSHPALKKQPVPNGVYDVTMYKLNSQVHPPSLSDTARWQNIIFENGLGSIKTVDSAFRVRYQRSYFAYSLDSAAHTLAFKKTADDSLPVLSFHYDFPDSNTVRLWGLRRSDSLYLELKRLNIHYQLTEKQFHWLSEANR